MWVFGYGSLIWKVDFPVEARLPGFVAGYRRAFYQGSHDHRGTPQAPGRVATLLPCPATQVTWGVVYKVLSSKVEEVRAHLDHREKNGYETLSVPVFHPQVDGPMVKDALLYVATPDNHAFLGEAPLPDMAAQIVRSVGPSGPNVEYVLGLEAALKLLGPQALDDHTRVLCDHIRSYIAEHGMSLHDIMKRVTDHEHGAFDELKALGSMDIHEALRRLRQTLN